MSHVIRLYLIPLPPYYQELMADGKGLLNMSSYDQSQKDDNKGYFLWDRRIISSIKQNLDK